MKPLPICYCRAIIVTRTATGAHIHDDKLVLPPTMDEVLAELARLRRYERAVVRWDRTSGVPTESNQDERIAATSALRRLAAASVKRDKKVRRA